MECDQHPKIETARKCVQGPIVTGTSVVGIVCKDGIVIGADCLGSYGSLARFKDQHRIQKIDSHAVIASSGDLSDFQHVLEQLKEISLKEKCIGDGHGLSPQNYHTWLGLLMYNRRSEMKPLWNSHVIGGISNGTSFLGHVDHLGTKYTSSTIATGFGAHLALPVLRDALESNPEMSLDDAKQLVETCMRLLYYRDARSTNQIQTAIITEDTIEISEPYTIESDWTIGKYIS